MNKDRCASISEFTFAEIWPHSERHTAVARPGAAHPLEIDGAPNVDFESGCTWGSEHGLGILMLGTRIVEIGGSDTAILLWIAERDAGLSL